MFSNGHSNSTAALDPISSAPVLGVSRFLYGHKLSPYLDGQAKSSPVSITAHVGDYKSNLDFGITAADKSESFAPPSKKSGTAAPQ